MAAVLVGREASRLAAAPPRPVFDVDEAVVWIADRLPESVASQLSHADVRPILLWSVEHLRLVALQERVAEEDETFGFVVDRAAEAGEDWSPLEVKAVLDGEADYLQLIGATGAVPSLPPEKGGGPTEDR